VWPPAAAEWHAGLFQHLGRVWSGTARASPPCVTVLIAVSCAFVLGLLVPADLSGGVRAILALSSLSIGLVFAASNARKLPTALIAATPLLLCGAAAAAGLAVGSPARAPPVLAPAGLARIVVRVEEVSASCGRA
jgi:hypothetical protein